MVIINIGGFIDECLNTYCPILIVLLEGMMHEYINKIQKEDIRG